MPLPEKSHIYSPPSRPALSDINQVRRRADAPQQHDGVAALQGGADLFPVVEQPPGLDVEDPQLVGLGLAAVVEVLDLQGAGGGVEDAAHDPVAAVEEVAPRVLGLGGGGLGLDVQVDALLGGELGVALGRLLEGVYGGEAGGGRGGFRLGQGAGGGLFLAQAPGLEPVQGRLGLGGGGVQLGGSADAEGGQVLAVVVLLEAVLEAVVAAAAAAVDAGRERRAHDGPAPGRQRAGLLLGHGDVAQGLARADGRLGEPREAPALRPGPLVGAPVRRLAAVVQAEGAAARLAVEREEVELVAVLVLAVLAHQGGVVHVRHLVARVLAVDVVVLIRV